MTGANSKRLLPKTDDVLTAGGKLVRHFRGIGEIQTRADQQTDESGAGFTAGEWQTKAEADECNVRIAQAEMGNERRESVR